MLRKGIFIETMRLKNKLNCFVGTVLFSIWIGIFPQVCLGDIKPPIFTVLPTIHQNPNPSVPLAAVIKFATDEPVHTVINVSDGKRVWDIEFDSSYKPAEGLPIIGMRPNLQHQFYISIHDIAGNKTNASKKLNFKTLPLPSSLKEFPPIDITVKHTDKMEPGITLLSVRRRMPGNGHRKFNQSFGMLLAIDAEGEVIWYYRANTRISDIERLRNGNLIYLTQDYRAIEIDLLGNVIASWYAAKRPYGPEANSIPVDTTTFHHKIKELPSGNFIVLGSELRLIDNYYTSETDPNAPRKTQKVMGDKIIEFQRDGKIVWQWNIFDHLDVFRIGYRMLTSKYWMMRGFPDTLDWSHANGLSYNEQDDSLLLSMRQQDAIFKIDKASNEIQWVLGELNDWPTKLQSKLLKPISDMKWFYHHHSPKITPSNTLILFDNGILQARPFYSPLPPAKTNTRVVEYVINEKNMTVDEIWSSENSENNVVSFAMGDVDWLPKTNNFLVSYGFLLPQDKINHIRWDNILDFRAWTRTREYTHTNPPELVWEVVMENNSKENSVGWIIFSAERVSNIF
ncbi:aryl-sulfate sulfotransferase [Candidatus Halobeggiatoa sp. HSG11]|nr:aryl-sulfate sulfotransferase [Candidatus Halobeggiatoa sp. HSG11]